MRLRQPPELVTLELPFAYEERGEHKTALVKVVLCRRCMKKLTWKRDQEKKGAKKGKQTSEPSSTGEEERTSRAPGGDYDEMAFQEAGTSGRPVRDRRSASPPARRKR